MRGWSGCPPGIPQSRDSEAEWGEARPALAALAHPNTPRHVRILATDEAMPNAAAFAAAGIKKANPLQDPPFPSQTLHGIRAALVSSARARALLLLGAGSRSSSSAGSRSGRGSSASSRSRSGSAGSRGGRGFALAAGGQGQGEGSSGQDNSVLLHVRLPPVQEMNVN